MTDQPLNILILSPGAGGMYCGSCLGDNMLATALGRAGHSVTLLPLYTPTLTDEPNASIDKLFLGGINVYLQQKVALFRRLPGFFDRILDRPWLVRKLAGRAIGIDANQLGALTLSMVRGEHGNQRKEIRRLVNWLASQPRPDVVNLSNLLIAGCVPAIKQRLGAAVVVTLHGDDLFLDSLPDEYRQPVEAELRGIARHVDRFLAHSAYYADAMARRFDLPRQRIDVVPLGISLEGFPEQSPPPADDRPRNLGYLARICEAKGFHLLVDAFLDLKQRPEFSDLQLTAAGWLSAADQSYFDLHAGRVRKAGWAGHFRYAGAPDRREKLALLGDMDLLCVPAVYREPKGRYVLEALAHGVPVVQPDHGAFPELLARTGGGRLFQAGNREDLVVRLLELLADPALRNELAVQGHTAVRRDAGADLVAQRTVEVYRRSLSG